MGLEANNQLNILDIGRQIYDIRKYDKKYRCLRIIIFSPRDYKIQTSF
jgi:hypothetical protein